MNKVLLEHIIQLFAIIANMYPPLLFENVRDFIKSFLLKEFNPEIVDKNLRLFIEYYKKYSDNQSLAKEKDYLQIELTQTLHDINKFIPKKQRYQILLRLLFFEKALLNFSLIPDKNQLKFTDILDLVIQNFHIDRNEYLNCQGFVSEKLFNVPEKSKLLIIGEKKEFDVEISFMQRNNLNCQLFFLYVENACILLFYYKGSASLTLNNHVLYPEQIYFFNKGYFIKGETVEPVYYNQVLQRFLSESPGKLLVQVNNIEYHYKNSVNGIHQLSMEIEQGQLIGIIGRSGSGKSTLLNILNGNIKPRKGSVTINNINLFSENKKLEGLIGYIPQDDLLIEDLSVFTNLYINAQLCFDNLSREELTEKVNSLLTELNLYDVRYLKVGNPMNKFISGGQRKKLNIALELIREPWILFADEPTSGLSSSDSEEIMQHLAEQTIKGCIVFVNIHQPSSDIFKLFDKIIILDKGGYPVFFGNPPDTVPYFNDFIQNHTIAADMCYVCESINPETIFKILEDKKVNEYGEYTSERKMTPAEWHNLYLQSTGQNKIEVAWPLPEIQLRKPNPCKQFIIFSKRNLLSKLANRPYILLVLLISPFLASVLAFLCKSGNSTQGTGYAFGANENIGSFLFISVIVALFLGLIISAEEIISDRRILLRESYLKLSKSGYLNSKVFYLFALSALQTFLFVLISNSVLQIPGMIKYFWMILFATSCFANMLGLFISSLFNSVVAIYIMVPLVMVPQILFRGVVVNFDTMNDKVSSKEVVPFTGDLIVSRWAFEALAVTQFKFNDYQKHLFSTEQQESNVKFDCLFVIPEVEKALKELKTLTEKEK